MSLLNNSELQVPWSRLGQDPVLVHLDRIFLLAEPSTQVEGSSEDAVQEVKRSRIRVRYCILDSLEFSFLIAMELLIFFSGIGNGKEAIGE